MASIVTRKSSFAVVHMITANGVRKQKWETYHTLPEAVRRKEQLELYHDLRKSKKIGGEVETVAQLMSVYLRLHGVPRWSPSTYQSNRGLIQHYILPCMGNMRLSELSPRTVAMLYSRMLEEPRISFPYHKQGGQKLSPTTLRSIHKVLHSAFEQAVLWEYMDRNPFHRVPLPVCRTKQKTFLTPEQIKRLVLYCSPTLALAIHLTFAASLRKGELLALTPADFDFEKRTVTINKSYQRLNGQDLITTPKTEKSNRVITMPQFLAEEIQDYLKMLYGIGADDRMFTVTKSYLHREMDRGSKEAGVPRIRIHDIRHSAVSLLIDMGFSATAIADRVGHESIDITYNYAHLFPSKQTEMANKLNMERGN